MTQLMEAEAQSTVLGTPTRELAFRIHTRHRPEASQVVLLSGQKVSFGADPDCTLRLAGAGVAPCYCLILRGEAHDVVRSLSPRARLNGTEFQDAPLHPGDRLRLDDLEFEVLPSGANDADHAAETDQSAPVGNQLSQRTAELEASEADVSRRQQALAELEERLAAERTALELWRNELEQQKQEFEQRRVESEQAATAREEGQRHHEAELSGQQAHLESERTSLKGWRVELEQQKADQEQRHGELDRRHGELDQYRQTLDQRQAEIDQTSGALNDERQHREAEWNDQRAHSESERASLKGWREELERQQTEMEQRRIGIELAAQSQLSELERRAAELRELEQRLAAEQIALDGWRQELDQRQLAERRQSDTRGQADTEAMQRLTTELEAREERLNHERQALEEGRRQLDQSRSELAMDRETFGAERAKSDQVRAQLDEEQRQLQTDRQEFEMERQELETERAALQQQKSDADAFAAEISERTAAAKAALEAQKSTLECERHAFRAEQAQLAAERQAFAEATAALVQGQEELAAQRSLSAEAVDASDAEALKLACDNLEQERLQFAAQRRQWDQECVRWEEESRAYQAELERREAALHATSERRDDRAEGLSTAQLFRRQDDTDEVTIDTQAERNSVSLPAAEEHHEEDGSIDAYMQQLLERAGAKPRETGTPSDAGAAASRYERTSSQNPAPQPESQPAVKPARRPERPKPPEMVVDLSTMREIANQTARGALDRHSERKTALRRFNRILVGGGSFAFLMIVLAALGMFPAVTSALAVAAAAVGFLGWRQYHWSLRKLEAAAAKLGSAPQEPASLANPEPRQRSAQGDQQAALGPPPGAASNGVPHGVAHDEDAQS